MIECEGCSLECFYASNCFHVLISFKMHSPKKAITFIYIYINYIYIFFLIHYKHVLYTPQGCYSAGKHEMPK